MAEELIEGMTKRQLLGTQYEQYSTNLPTELFENRVDEKYLIEISGKAKQPPEIEQLTQILGAFVIYYDLDRFIISHKFSGKEYRSSYYNAC